MTSVGREGDFQDALLFSHLRRFHQFQTRHDVPELDSPVTTDNSQPHAIRREHCPAGRIGQRPEQRPRQPTGPHVPQLNPRIERADRRQRLAVRRERDAQNIAGMPQADGPQPQHGARGQRIAIQIEGRSSARARLGVVARVTTVGFVSRPGQETSRERTREHQAGSGQARQDRGPTTPPPTKHAPQQFNRRKLDHHRTLALLVLMPERNLEARSESEMGAISYTNFARLPQTVSERRPGQVPARFSGNAPPKVVRLVLRS